MKPEILFEDGEAIVINKPGGLPIDKPRKGGVSLCDYLDELKMGFKRQPVPVHRLDQDTSGCLLLARNPKALKKFNKAFEDRLVRKKYLGVLDGTPEIELGRIDLSVLKVSSAENGWRMIPARKGKTAVTDWFLRQENNGLSLVEFTPETGRTHQLRVHSASGIGIPLLGDTIYGRKGSAARTLLHALALIVPRVGKPDIVASAPIPDDFIRLGFG